MSKPVIVLKGVHQEFKAGDETITPLKNISFDIKENSFNIIYGPSGSGKSTLLNVLTGLQKPSSGTVEVEGRNMYELSRDELAHFRANRLGFVYQDNYWVKSLNVLDNVAMSLYFMGYNREKAAKLALDALKLVQMERYAKTFPALLSGGEQQRIAMARALVTDPLFLVADEPTGSLDSKNGEMIIRLLRDFQSKLKHTIILVTHNMEYLPLADQILHIEDGAIQRAVDGDVQKIADDLLKDMKVRINRLASERKHHVK
jgi:ABC-type lipoprotein export system ATPase subunit